MKKFARLLAVVLAGVMLFSMTACGGSFSETNARKTVLKEINAYRKTLEMDELTENKDLGSLAGLFTVQFEGAGETVLPKETIDGTNYTYYWNEVQKSEEMSYCGRWGAKEEDGKYILLSEYKADSLKTQIAEINELKDSDVKYIGLGFAELGDKVYWVAEFAKQKAS